MPKPWKITDCTFDFVGIFVSLMLLVKIDAVDVGFEEHLPELGYDVEREGEPDGRNGRQPLQGQPHHPRTPRTWPPIT